MTSVSFIICRQFGRVMSGAGNSCISSSSGPSWVWNGTSSSMFITTKMLQITNLHQKTWRAPVSPALSLKESFIFRNFYLGQICSSRSTVLWNNQQVFGVNDSQTADVINPFATKPLTSLGLFTNNTSGACFNPTVIEPLEIYQTNISKLNHVTPKQNINITFWKTI